MFQSAPSSTSTLPYSNGHLSPPSSKSFVNGAGTSASESDLSEALDLPNASVSFSNSERYAVDDDTRAQSTIEESEEDAIGDDDPDFDIATPAIADQQSLDDPPSSSDESPRQRKRKADVGPEDYILNDPELYGLRRSVGLVI